MGTELGRVTRPTPPGETLCAHSGKEDTNLVGTNYHVALHRIVRIDALRMNVAMSLVVAVSAGRLGNTA